MEHWQIVLYIHTLLLTKDRLKAMETIALKDGKVYDMVYYAKPERYNNYLPTIQKMIDSIEFVDFIPYINPIPYGISTRLSF